MYPATSKNVLFVYSLLLIDLLVNITDNLVTNQRQQNYYWLAFTSLNGGQNFRRINIISSSTFATILIQILAIICVVISLALRFFDVADRVRESAWLVSQKTLRRPQRKQGNNATDDKSNSPHADASTQQEKVPRVVVAPMPQRTALKLVLDRYWWSLVVGLTYLVLTIILQLNKIDSQRWPMSVAPQVVMVVNRPTSSAGQQVAPGIMPESQVSTGEASPTHTAGNNATDETLPELPSGSSSSSYDEGSFLPILIVLIHKLMSTCYYVSFVVVYRTSPVQMVNRVLSVNEKQLAATSSKPLLDMDQ